MLQYLVMFPPIKYKLHPKAQEIMEEKQRRKQELQRAREKEAEQLVNLKEDRGKYMQQNKESIEIKKQAIYQRKLNQRNRIREEDITRAQRIANKKSQLLMKMIPERRAMIESLRQEYLENAQRRDAHRQQKLRAMIQERLEAESQKFRLTMQVPVEQKIKDQNLIDTNDGTCVICLVEKAEVFMVVCRHLICCTGCEFMIRMNKKCPLCRAPSNYQNIHGNKKNKTLPHRTK